jgi:PIN domain nuclease of toxin-antitoxin system
VRLLLDTHAFIWWFSAQGKLPSYHKDPFDRLLIAQAIAEDVALISSDHQLIQYPAKIIW